MKMVVIGGTRYIRLATVERLRQQGHDVVAASPQRRALTTAAPHDPGHAGRPLREFLENTASVLRHLWHGRQLWLRLLRQRLGGPGLGPREGRLRRQCRLSQALALAVERVADARRSHRGIQGRHG